MGVAQLQEQISYTHFYTMLSDLQVSVFSLLLHHLKEDLKVAKKGKCLTECREPNKIHMRVPSQERQVLTIPHSQSHLQHPSPVRVLSKVTTPIRKPTVKLIMFAELI